jgi:HSP20 family protein
LSGTDGHTVEVSEMQLVRWEPLWLAELEEDIDRLVGTTFGAWPTPRWYRALPLADQGRWMPASDVFERDGDLVIRLDLPGIDPDKDVRVTVEDGILCISGERKRAPAVGGHYYRQEWSYGSFERSIRVSKGVQADDITASYDNGVLEIVVPKAVRLPQQKRIEVRTKGTRELSGSSA